MNAATMTTPTDTPERPKPALWSMLALLRRDKFALAAAIFLSVTVLAALIAPALLGGTGINMDLMARNAPPFELERGFWYILDRTLWGARSWHGSSSARRPRF